MVRVVKFASPASLSGVSRRREQWLDFEARAWSGRWGTSSAESSHVPVGVQVLGDRFTDLRCLDVAAQIQSAVGAPVPIDPVTA